MAKKRKVKKGESRANNQELDEKSKKFIYLIAGIFVLLLLLFVGLEISQG